MGERQGKYSDDHQHLPLLPAIHSICHPYNHFPQAKITILLSAEELTMKV